MIFAEVEQKIKENEYLCSNSCAERLALAGLDGWDDIMDIGVFWTPWF